MPGKMIGLLGGAYSARSFTAANQTRGNLYSEQVPQIADEPFQYSQYQRAGLTLFGNASTTIGRCVYRASNDELYVVYGQNIYLVSTTGHFTLIGTMLPSALSNVVPLTIPISMIDNGTDILIADGTIGGWLINLSTKAFSAIDINALTIVANSANIVSGGVNFSVGDQLTLTGTSVLIQVLSTNISGAILTQNVVSGGSFDSEDTGTFSSTGGTGTGATFTLNYSTSSLSAGWLGSPRVDILNTFFLASQPNSTAFYVSESNSTNFDATQVANTTIAGDPITGIIANHGNIWIICRLHYEIWTPSTVIDIVNSLPFTPITNATGNWGSGAVYSIATAENQIFWLAQDKYGSGMIFRGENFSSERISNYAVENAIQDKQNYPILNDATAYCYQLDGHLFYQITFPSAYNGRGATWVYDNRNKQWHEEWYSDDNGIRYRHRVQCASSASPGLIIGCDWLNENLYIFDLNNYTDNGQLIRHVIRTPHQISINNFNRQRYSRLIADMEVGSATQTASPSIPVIRASLDATDGTLLQNYNNPYDLNSIFTFESGGTYAEILNDSIVGVGAGTANYKIGNTPPNKADYVITMPISITTNTLTPANGSNAFVISRAIAGNGYKAEISSNGTIFSTSLKVMNGGSTITVHMGTPITSGHYQLTLTTKGTSISVQVFRSTDNTYLIPSGTWNPVPANAILITDNTYQTIGDRLVGGNWS